MEIVVELDGGGINAGPEGGREGTPLVRLRIVAVLTLDLALVAGGDV